MTCNLRRSAVARQLAGEDTSAITKNTSRFLPHAIVG